MIFDFDLLIDLNYGQEYISLLARQGKIDAYKEGVNKMLWTYILNRKRKDERFLAITPTLHLLAKF